MTGSQSRSQSDESANAAIAFVDLAGYTALTEAHGDYDATEVAGRFFDLTESSLQGAAELVKTIGDAVMIAAPGAEDALRSVVSLIQSVANEPLFPALRAGLHYGPVIRRGADYYGATVNVAARVASYARTGQALCTVEFAAQIDLPGLVELVGAGRAKFKNVSAPVDLHEILLHANGATAEAIDPICKMRVQPGSAPGRLVHDDHVHYFCSLECARQFLVAQGVSE